jgi:FkbM family methyltransferase
MATASAGLDEPPGPRFRSQLTAARSGDGPAVAAERRAGTSEELRMPWRTYLRYLTRAASVPWHYPGSLPSLLRREWQRLEPLKAELSGWYTRRRPAARRAEGLQVWLDPEDTAFVSPSLARFGWYELATMELLERYLPPGGTYIDVGAQIGWLTLWGARQVGTLGRVLALEPEPTARSILERSVRSNRLDQVVVLPFAASDQNSAGLLHRNRGPNRGAHSLFREFPGGERIGVECRTLASVLEEHDVESIDVLKIDVEGAEPQVLRGLGPTWLDGRVRSIAMEWNPEAWDGHRDLIRDLETHFAAYRYDGNVPFRYLTPTPLDPSPQRGCVWLRGFGEGNRPGVEGT